MTGKYAATTSVSVEKSRAEIEATLARYGADAFYYGAEPTMAMVGFRLSGRMIRFKMAIPDQQDRIFTHHSQGARVPEAAAKAWEQACRQHWRALALVIKAKLEAVAAGITTVEDEFLAHTMLPDGRTVGEWAEPQLTIAYETGVMPSSLLLTGPS